MYVFFVESVLNFIEGSQVGVRAFLQRVVKLVYTKVTCSVLFFSESAVNFVGCSQISVHESNT